MNVGDRVYALGDLGHASGKPIRAFSRGTIIDVISKAKMRDSVSTAVWGRPHQSLASSRVRVRWDSGAEGNYSMDLLGQ